MRAVQLQEADRAAAVAKRDEVLAEDPELERQVFQLVRIADRLPEAAHVFAAGRVRADTRQLCIFRGHLAVVVSAVARLEERGPGCHRAPPVQNDVSTGCIFWTIFMPRSCTRAAVVGNIPVAARR